MSEQVTYQVVTKPEDLDRIVAIEEAVWGKDTSTPQSQLTAAVHHGGVVIAAVQNGEYIGFCYGFAGFSGKETYLVSHMAAVLPEYRDLGLGRAIKEEQRLWALDYGYKKMIWTFDPLQVRNANLNLIKLGGLVRMFVPDMYGEIHDQINAGQATDRFVLDWELSSERVEKALRGESPFQERWNEYPEVCGWHIEDGLLKPGPDLQIGQTSGIRIPVPNGWHPYDVPEWRMVLRRFLTERLAQKYIVTGLIRTQESVHYYVLEEAH